MSHRMNSPIKFYKNSISRETEKSLCQYLLSPHRCQPLTYYKKLYNLHFPETGQKVTQRLYHLKKISKDQPGTFLQHCQAYNILVPVTLYENIDSSNSENNNSHNSNDSYNNYSISDSCKNNSYNNNNSYNDNNSYINNSNNSKDSNTFESHTQYSTEKTPDKVMPVQANANTSGKRIALHLCNGLIFFIFWTDDNLDKDYLSISTSEDGHHVIQKQAQPITKDATELIKKFAWS
eukprot:15044017-Ditylum_brightwellii.AAC.1